MMTQRLTVLYMLFVVSAAQAQIAGPLEDCGLVCESTRAASRGYAVSGSSSAAESNASESAEQGACSLAKQFLRYELLSACPEGCVPAELMACKCPDGPPVDLSCETGTYDDDPDAWETACTGSGVSASLCDSWAQSGQNEHYADCWYELDATCCTRCFEDDAGGSGQRSLGPSTPTALGSSEFGDMGVILALRSSRSVLP